MNVIGGRNESLITGFSEKVLGCVAVCFIGQKLLSGSFTEVFKPPTPHGVRWEILRFND